MRDIASITSTLNLVGLGGLGVFLWYTFRGLRERIVNLTELAREQRETLQAVRSRAEEADRLSKAYKDALFDFQEMGKRLDERRNELVSELESANQRKDGELARLAHLQLEEIDLKKKSLDRLPGLEQRLESVVGDLERQLHILTPDRPFRSFLLARDFDQLSLFDDPRDRLGWELLGGMTSGKTALMTYVLRNWLKTSSGAKGSQSHQAGEEEEPRRHGRAEGKEAPTDDQRT